MVQNHALQLLCAIAMEPPINATADAIRDEKLKVLHSLVPWTPATLSRDVVRGQYTAGSTGGERVPGYAEETGVPPDSRTETFVALRTEIANCAGPACPSTSAPASGWQRTRRTSPSISAPRPSPTARPSALPTGW